MLKGIFTSKKNDGSTELVCLNALFREFYDRLVYFSFQFVKNKHHAKDIVQDAFVKYWDARENVASDKIAIKNFLYSTVRNASLNSIRHEKVVESYAQLHNSVEPEQPAVIEAIIAAEVISALHSAVQSLPENHKQVSILSYMEGKKNQEIADELNMSINTVKKQKQRALQLLRLKLEPEIFIFIVAVSASLLGCWL
jgi:RNA polymerase sigma-70 factor (ECF subfamily)